MATAMHLCGVQTPFPDFSAGPFNLRLLRPKNVLHLERSVVSITGSSRTYNDSYRFGGSSVACAERMKEVADLILSFPEERPVILLSAMGNTTDMLLMAGKKAISCGVSKVFVIDELTLVKNLYSRTVVKLGIKRSTILPHLEELEQLLEGIAMMKELTPRTTDYLVSFGECMSTRIFAAFLNKIGVKARQYDAFDIGFLTTDDFTNADMLEATYPAVAKRLNADWIADPAIPIVTGFLGKGQKSGAVTTLGRGGSGLTATTIGKALGLQEIQVWKDADGVLTCDPNIYQHAEPVPRLTFDEAAELAYFGAQAFHVLHANGVNVQMISQGASKVNISLIVNDSESERCVRALHSAFFESDVSEL